MNKIDYENKRLNQIKQAKNNKLLLHSCCAPCSSGVIDRLVDFFDITIYFYNPNMDTEEEFIKRANEQVRYVNERYGDKIKVITKISPTIRYTTTKRRRQSEHKTFYVLYTGNNNHTDNGSFPSFRRNICSGKPDTRFRNKSSEHHQIRR